MHEHGGDGSNNQVIRVGEFLVGIGAMTSEQVATVLAAQENEPERLFGEIAIEMGFVDDAAIDKYVAAKYGQHPSVAT